MIILSQEEQVARYRAGKPIYLLSKWEIIDGCISNLCLTWMVLWVATSCILPFTVIGLNLPPVVSIFGILYAYTMGATLPIAFFGGWMTKKMKMQLWGMVMYCYYAIFRELCYQILLLRQESPELERRYQKSMRRMNFSLNLMSGIQRRQLK